MFQLHDLKSTLPTPLRLLEYLDWADMVPYDLSLLIETRETFTPLIVEHARANGMTVPTLMSRDNLPSGWETVCSEPSFGNTTSGTTDGQPFTYRIWTAAWRKIENHHHYQAINAEFGLDEVRHVAHLRTGAALGDDRLFRQFRTKNAVLNHGCPDAIVHLRVTGSDFVSDHTGYVDRTIDYLESRPMDVIVVQGSFLASLVGRLQVTGRRPRLGRLLSSTFDAVSRRDLDWLQANGCVDVWCDHMRCWDGGAGFMTCRYGLTHLTDHLADIRSMDGKLVSTDWFNLHTPFVNYWNGDWVEIGNDWSQCVCGRWRRDFRFTSPRITEQDSLLCRLISGLELTKLKRVVRGEQVLLFVNAPLATDELVAVRAALGDVEVIVEPC